jgi:hypothetical protein
MAANVPSIVATTAARIDTVSVVVREDIMALSWKSSRYQSNVKPVQTVRLFVELNEKTMRMAIGAYKKYEHEDQHRAAE